MSTGTSIQTEVLIAGAGPTGLALACQLARYGVDFVIADKNDGLTPFSKAIGVHARTLEIYDQLGLAREAIEQGAISRRMRLLAGGEVRGELDLSGIGGEMSPFPFVLALEQSKNEALLHKYLQGSGRHVRWSTTLESFSQHADGVTAQLQAAGGAQTIQAKYLVGCDGPRSAVRHGLGLSFGGSTLERMFYVADVRLSWGLGHDAVQFFLARESFLLVFPLKDENRFRLVGVFPEEFAGQEGEVLYEEIERRIREQAQVELDITHVEWFSTYKVHTRHAESFSQGRCFLAGDAAHIHTPAGAQGMNTGIQDGYNLAWKLALVLQGHADEPLLETYNEERLENARNLLRTTDRMFHAAADPDWLLALLRTHIVPPLAHHLFGFDMVKKALFPRLSQIGISYRHGSLSRHHGDAGFRVQAGDRMPYFHIDGASIYDRLREPTFHALLFSNEKSEASASDERFKGWADFHAFPLSAPVVEAFGRDTPFGVLLRPDGYIALLSPGTATDSMQDYLGALGRA